MNDQLSPRLRQFATYPDYAGGTPAPAAGTYEQLNVFGRATGHRVTAEKGEPLPALPRGFSWRPVDDG